STRGRWPSIGTAHTPPTGAPPEAPAPRVLCIRLRPDEPPVLAHVAQRRSGVRSPARVRPDHEAAPPPIRADPDPTPTPAAKRRAATANGPPSARANDAPLSPKQPQGPQKHQSPHWKSRGATGGADGTRTRGLRRDRPAL